MNLASLILYLSMPSGHMKLAKSLYKIIIFYWHFQSYTIALMAWYFTRIRLSMIFVMFDIISNRFDSQISIHTLPMSLLGKFQNILYKTTFWELKYWNWISVLLPAYNSSNSYQKMPLFNILSDLCGHPSYKMLTCRSLPQFNPQKSSFQQYSTDLMLKYLHQLNHTGTLWQLVTSSDLLFRQIQWECW